MSSNNDGATENVQAGSSPAVECYVHVMGKQIEFTFDEDSLDNMGELGADSVECYSVPVETPVTGEKAEIMIPKLEPLKQNAGLAQLTRRVERRGWLWEVGKQVEGGYHATVWRYEGTTRQGSFSSVDAGSAQDALREAYKAAKCT